MSKKSKRSNRVNRPSVTSRLATEATPSEFEMIVMYLATRVAKTLGKPVDGIVRANCTTYMNRILGTGYSFIFDAPTNPSDRAIFEKFLALFDDDGLTIQADELSFYVRYERITATTTYPCDDSIGWYVELLGNERVLTPRDLDRYRNHKKLDRITAEYAASIR